MTSKRFIFLFFKLLVFLGLLGTLVVFVIYLSRDVSELKIQYPHSNDSKKSTAFIFKPHPPKDWVKLDDISRYAKWAIILTEDWSFYKHQGIDFEQIKIALDEMIFEHKFRGASTITQQMVKNIYLTHERTLWRKFHEIIISQKVEKNISKNRILEIYFNVIEFGPKIYGIRKACSYYFNKAPSQLNPLEGAFLAMVLPSPKRYSRSFTHKKLTPFARERIREILGKMRMGKIISQRDYEDLVKSKLSWER